MKCGCKRNLLGVCSCKRVSRGRGRGRRTRRALTDEPYERAIRPRYAVPRSRRPELNFPDIDPKRPGQVLKPGVPSVSKGFTAPSPFSRGATSAFEPVLRAASNYLNEVTKSARLQNQITMSNMGGGGSAGSRSNIAVNGSVNSRNTQNILSANPTSAPINENINVINSDGNYQTWRNNLEEFQNNANTAIRNLNRTAAISADNSSVNDITPQNIINYQNQVDQAVAENDLNSSTQAISDNNLEEILQENRNLNDSVSELADQSINLHDNDKFLFTTYNEGDDKKKREIQNYFKKRDQLDDFYAEYRKWEKFGSPKPNMKNVQLSGDFRETPLSERSNFEEIVNVDSSGRVRTYRNVNQEDDQVMQNLDPAFDRSMSPIPNRPQNPSSSSSSSRTQTASTPSSSSSSSRTQTASTPSSSGSSSRTQTAPSSFSSSSIGSNTGTSSSSSIGSKSSSKKTPQGNDPLSLLSKPSSVFGSQSSPSSEESGFYIDDNGLARNAKTGSLASVDSSSSSSSPSIEPSIEKKVKKGGKRQNADQEVAAKEIFSPNTRKLNKQERTKKDKEEIEASKNLKKSELQENKSKNQKMKEYYESLKK